MGACLYMCTHTFCLKFVRRTNAAQLFSYTSLQAAQGEVMRAGSGWRVQTLEIIRGPFDPLKAHLLKQEHRYVQEDKVLILCPLTLKYLIIIPRKVYHLKMSVFLCSPFEEDYCKGVCRYLLQRTFWFPDIPVSPYNHRIGDSGGSSLLLTEELTKLCLLQMYCFS